MVVPYATAKPVTTMVRVPGSGSSLQAGSVLCDLSKVSSVAATVSVPQIIPKDTLRPTRQSPKSSSDPSHPRGNVNNGACAEKLLDESAKNTLKEMLPRAESEDSTASSKRKRMDSENENKKDNRQTNLASSKIVCRDNAATPKTQIQFQTTSLNCPTQSRQVLLVPSTQGQRLQMIPMQQSSLPPTQIAIQTTPIVLLQGNQTTVNSGVLIQSNRILQLGTLQHMNTAPAAPTNNMQRDYQDHHMRGLLQERDQLKKENQALAEKIKKFQKVFKNKDNLQYLADRLAQAS